MWLSLLHVQVRSKRPSNEQRATILLTVSAAVKVHHLNHPRDLNFGDVVHAQQDIESAAARAGMRVQDRVIAIDGKKVGTSALVEWRTKLRELPVGTKLKVDRMRDGKKETVELVLADRIPLVFK